MTTDAARAAYRAEKDALQRLLDLAECERAAALENLRASDAALAAVVARRLALSDTPRADPAQAPAPPRIARAVRNACSTSTFMAWSMAAAVPSA